MPNIIRDTRDLEKKHKHYTFEAQAKTIVQKVISKLQQTIGPE